MSKYLMDKWGGLLLVLQLLDTRRFTLFYRFVFFMCRERGQKSICKSVYYFRSCEAEFLFNFSFCRNHRLVPYEIDEK